MSGMDYDPMFRRELLGEWKTQHIRDRHPFPWDVRPFRERERCGVAPAVFLIVDANGKKVADCDDQADAFAIAQAMNDANRPPPPHLPGER